MGIGWLGGFFIAILARMPGLETPAQRR